MNENFISWNETTKFPYPNFFENSWYIFETLLFYFVVFNLLFLKDKANKKKSYKEFSILVAFILYWKILITGQNPELKKTFLILRWFANM